MSIEIILIQTMLHEMDHDFVESDLEKYNLSYDVLAAHLETVKANQHAETVRVLGLAPTTLWKYYEDTGVTGQPEQRMLKDARAATRRAIRNAFQQVRAVQKEREAADRASKAAARRAESRKDSGGESGSTD